MTKDILSGCLGSTHSEKDGEARSPEGTRSSCPLPGRASLSGGEAPAPRIQSQRPCLSSEAIAAAIGRTAANDKLARTLNARPPRSRPPASSCRSLRPRPIPTAPRPTSPRAPPAPTTGRATRRRPSERLSEADRRAPAGVPGRGSAPAGRRPRRGRGSPPGP